MVHFFSPRKFKFVLIRVALLALVAVPLTLLTDTAARAASTSLVINEIDYDQPSTDTAEFVEIKNVSADAINLNGWTLELVNGTGGGASVYNTIVLPDVNLAAGDYFVVCGDTASVANCDLDVSPDSNLIQNGSPDAVGLRNMGALIDAVSYEGDSGPPYTEGSGSGLEDRFSISNLGISRFPDGSDTDQNNADLSQRCITPGAANTDQATDCVIVLTVSISEIQGAGHISPYAGQEVATTGLVTAVAFDGYYVQDPAGDGNSATSDGVFVFVSRNPKPNVGDLVELTGPVTEFIPGGADTGNLSITEMSFPIITVLSSGNPLPAPVIIGSSGRIPPNVDVISEDELPVNLQTSAGIFDPDNDGIDFFESLEGMLVTVEDPLAVSATRTFNAFSSELFTLPNNGKHRAPKNALTERGGINLQPDPDNRGDQNPERVQIQFDGTLFPFPVPAITVGDRLGDVTGVVGYSFGNFEVNAIDQFSITPSGLGPETTSLVGTEDSVTVASYNVLNLSPLSSDDSQRATLAAQIVHNLGSPDIVALQEIQDNSGETDDGTTDAALTLQTLANAIAAAGGPAYLFFDVAPEDGTSGGVPGGNIRNAFLYNPERVELDGFLSLTQDVLADAGANNPNAFFDSRNPLAATFSFDGEAFTVINNHLSSRSGSSPIFGGPQPFFQAAETDREAQVQALNDYVDFLLDTNKEARVIVLGDFNTFEFTNDLTEILPGTLDGQAIMKTLLGEVEDDNRYTFIFDGNSQVLDHMFATRSLLEGAELDIVHVNVDFPRVDDTIGSDHEPLLARFNLQ